MTRHPVGRLVVEAIDGRFPAADGGWRRVPPWRDGVEAVIALTGHAVLAVGEDVADDRLRALGVDGTGGAAAPRVALDLAGPDGWIDSLDCLLGRRAAPSPADGAVPDLHERAAVDGPDEHHRVRFALAVRSQVRVFETAPGRDDTDLATLARGVGGLTELSVELAPDRRGRGRASALVRAALARCLPDEPVVAAVAPGNAASLRAFLAAGFVPLGSSQLIRPRRGPAPAAAASPGHPPSRPAAPARAPRQG